MTALGRAGVSRHEVRLMNLSNYRPQGNDFEELEGSAELTEGKAELVSYLNEHRPNIVVPLGARALEFFTGKHGIYSWRGSFLHCVIPGLESLKILPTFHPSAVLRERQLYPTFDLDIKRAVKDSEHAGFDLPQRTYVTDPRGIQLEEIVQELEQADRLAVDIESVRNSTHILCVGFSPRPDYGVCIVNHQDNQYNQVIDRLLRSPAKKIFHFGTFDTEMLHLNGFEVENYWWDTMVAQHIFQPELPRGLDYLTSIYTREPYYKAEGRSEIPGDKKSWSSKAVKENLWIYNCKDVCVTAEIQLAQELEFNDEPARLYELFHYEMELLQIATQIGRAGVPIDTQRKELFERSLNTRRATLQVILNAVCGTEVNVRSPKLKELLYEKLNLPVRRQRGQGITTNEDAIVSLIGYCTDYMAGLKTDAARLEWNRKLLVCKAILEIRGIRQLLSNYITIPISQDGRMRGIYKVASTETGRWAGEGYLDGTGCNPQTFPRSMIEVADNDTQ